jgi:hypothetical protein
MKLIEALEKLSRATAELAEEFSFESVTPLSADKVMNHLMYYKDAGMELVGLLVELEIEFCEKYAINIEDVLNRAGLELKIKEKCITNS